MTRTLWWPGLVLALLVATDGAAAEDLCSQKVFNLAEVGLEAGREQLRIDDASSASPGDLDDELSAAPARTG